MREKRRIHFISLPGDLFGGRRTWRGLRGRCGRGTGGLLRGADGSHCRERGTGVVGGKERGKRSGELRASSNARVTRLVLSLVPKRVGLVTRLRRRFNYFYSSLRFTRPRHPTAMPLPLILVPSYNGYLEVPSSHDLLHLHKPFHLPPPSAHLSNLPQICRNIDKIGGGDERS